MNDLLSIDGSGSSQTDLLIQAFRNTKQPQIDALKQKKTDLEKSLTFFNQLNSRLTVLVSAIDKFTATNANDNFFTKSVTSSNNDILSASSSTNSLLGENKVKVERLATNDMLISNSLNLSDEFGQIGPKAINIKVGDNTIAISVDFDGTETNEQAMKKIAKAINDTEDVNLKVSFVKDTETTGRLSFASIETGKNNAIEISGSDMLLALGIRSDQVNANQAERTTINGTSAGYQTANTSNLNSKILLNGIEVIRSSNTVEDALEGVTLTLKKVQSEDDAPVNLTTEINTKGVEDFINQILKGFNELLTHLQSSKTILRADAGINSLQSSLRNIISQAVTSIDDNTDPKYLMDIGIKIGTNGTLSISDSDKLRDWLENDPQKVANLFTSEDGFIAKIQNVTAAFTGDDNMVKLRNKSINEQINDINKRTATLSSRIDQQAETLRKEYNNYLKAFYEAQAQFSLIMTMPTSSSNAFDSLL